VFANRIALGFCVSDKSCGAALYRLFNFISFFIDGNARSKCGGDHQSFQDLFFWPHSHVFLLSNHGSMVLHSCKISETLILSLSFPLDLSSLLLYVLDLMLGLSSRALAQ
jgi:hypothetical protein